ncbi:MAG: hypothetical protein HQL71_15345 [Magnetococcales bacterium]|nr:hypothetical protein [Magnetococcales bacterium]
MIRQIEQISEFQKVMPGLLKHIDDLRLQKGKEVEAWAEFCYLPYSATSVLVGHIMETHHIKPVKLSYQP